MIRCNKHGIVRHDTVATCVLCKQENTPSKEKEALAFVKDVANLSTLDNEAPKILNRLICKARKLELLDNSTEPV